MFNNTIMSKYDVAVIGLGYVGLPLAVAFSKKYDTVGYDINNKRIEDLILNIDTTNEIEDFEQLKKIHLTNNIGAEPSERWITDY